MYPLKINANSQIFVTQIATIVAICVTADAT